MPVTFDTAGDAASYGDNNTWDGMTAFTVMVWKYQTTAQGNGSSLGASIGIFGKDGTNSTDNLYIFYNETAGGANPGTLGIHYAGVSAFTANNTIVNDVWQHICTRYDSSQSLGSRGTFFVNGASTATSSDNLGTNFNSSALSLTLGSLPGVFGGWTGTLAHLKAWNIALSASDIAAEWQYAEPQTNHANLIMYAPLEFTSNAATACEDYSGVTPFSSIVNSPSLPTVSSPPVIWPAGSILPSRNNRRRMGAWKRNRFQRIQGKRPLVQYG